MTHWVLFLPLHSRESRFLQDLCRGNKGWDEGILRWVCLETWKAQVQFLSNVSVDSCVKPRDFRRAVRFEMHNLVLCMYRLS